MKKIRLLGYFILLMTFSGLTLADSVIVKETTTWKSVPIKVDTGANTYTVVGTVPTDTTDYYYSYPGYRCFQQQREIVGVNAVIFKAGVSSGSDIYCYPE